jgi:hypothetical protein
LGGFLRETSRDDGERTGVDGDTRRDVQEEVVAGGDDLDRDKYRVGESDTTNRTSADPAVQAGAGNDGIGHMEAWHGRSWLTLAFTAS